MTNAILTLDGMQPLDGTADKGGDVVRLRITGPSEADDFTLPATGQIEIDGQTSKVALENVTTEQGGVVLVLRLFTPLA